MKKAAVLLIVGFLAGPLAASPITVATTPSVDTFVRANAPNKVNGTRGGLSVAGSASRNGSGDLVGLAETFMRFDLGAAAASLDAHFGGHDWTISGVTLDLAEFAAPANAAFGRGQGQFTVQWLAADGWDESTLTWNTKDGYLNAGADVPLGTFTNLFQGDPFLVNVYHALCQPEGATAGAAVAAKFVEFLASEEAQKIIRQFGKDRYGQGLYEDAPRAE